MPSRVRAFPWLFAALAACSLAPPASAQTPPALGNVQLRWDLCYGDGGIDNRSFACNTSIGAEQLLVSVTPEEEVPLVTGMELRIRVLSSTSTLPSWWQFQSGTGCRLPTQIALISVPPDGYSGCRETWFFPGASVLLYAYPATAYPYAGRADIADLRVAIGGASPVTLSAGEEVFMATIQVTHTRTTGTGSCAGCSTPVGLGLDWVKLSGLDPESSVTLVRPIPGTNSDRVTFQPGFVVQETMVHEDVDGWVKYYGLASATDAKRPTWGGVKSLYR